MRVEFTKSVVCDGRPFAAGAVVDASAVPPDHLASCLRLGYARAFVPPAPATEPLAALDEHPPEPEPQQPKKKK